MIANVFTFGIFSAADFVKKTFEVDGALVELQVWYVN